MGVVYKAEDTNLDRLVALKFLPDHLLGDEEVRKRFKREAKAAASLDHANVCTVYEIDEVDGNTFIAMSLVEGESLDKKIAAGPLTLPEALDIARQIATGLEAAHEKGVVHRDIKPENVMIGESSNVTVMDFGLAQLTQASRLTQADQTMGTTAYMSPEQTQGSGTDLRTDIWALGVVLYEMVTGSQPFQGDYGQAVMYSILNEAPEPITALRAGVPMELEFIVQKCLEKDASDRYSSATEVTTDLGRLADKLKSPKSVVAKTVVAAPAARPARTRELLWMALAGILGLILLSISFFFLPNREAAPSVPVRSFAIDTRLPVASSAISPNGRYIAYEVAGGESERQLQLHDLQRGTSRELPDTRGGIRPFWSPDSRFVGFGLSDSVVKIEIEDNAVTELASLDAQVNYGTWRQDGSSVVVSVHPTGGLWEIPAIGGPAELLLAPDGDVTPAMPHALRAVEQSAQLLFRDGGGANAVARPIYSLGSGLEQPIEVARGGLFCFAPSGYLIYQSGLNAQSNTLFAMHWEGGQPSETPFPIARNVNFPSVSGDGTLAYLEIPEPANSFAWRQRDGGRTRSGDFDALKDRALSIRGDGAALSPDGEQIAFTSASEIWSYDFAQSTLRRVAEASTQPQWSPDGLRLAVSGDERTVSVRAADGGGNSRIVPGQPAPTGTNIACDWSRDGRFLLFQVQLGDGIDLWYTEVSASGELGQAVPYLESPYNDNVAQISPDGNYVAYCSDESGRIEVYVRPFPSGDDKWLVSGGGGAQPRWSHDGSELYYVQDDTLNAVSVSLDPRFRPGRTTKLFSSPELVHVFPRQTYGVTSDGRFLLRETTDDSGGGARIRVIQNWRAAFGPPN